MDSIELFYKQMGLMPLLMKKKVEDYKRNPDIANEFMHWIEKKEYVIDGCVEVNGYSAEKIALQFPQLDGDSVFSLMIELRENPGKAKERIDGGFKVL